MALLEIRMVHWLRQQKYLYFFIIYFRDKNEKKNQDQIKKADDQVDGQDAISSCCNLLNIQGGQYSRTSGGKFYL